uniref:hypothetical protein n=1 Tax=Gelidibacter sp. TaxID=2018083 RepID=UPI00404AB0B2
MQSGHEIPIKILVHNIKQFYNTTYNTGQTVTTIEFMDGTANDFVNNLNEVDALING